MRTWPRERPNSSWVAVVVLGGGGDDLWNPPREEGRCGLVVWQLMNGPHGQGVTHTQCDWQHTWLSSAGWLRWTVFSFLQGQLDLGAGQCLWLNQLKHNSTFIYMSRLAVITVVKSTCGRICNVVAVTLSMKVMSVMCLIFCFFCFVLHFCCCQQIQLTSLRNCVSVAYNY